MTLLLLFFFAVKHTDTREYDDGVGDYELKAIVVHIGRNTHSGHYVAYVHEANTPDWLLFNDEKVCRVQPSSVPIEKAYLMLYTRL
jgi:ubiquitin carboxyl-terminal hydrolase 5/13